MAGVNKVILLGNLGADPEVRYLPSGVAVASFSLATTETYTKDGEKVTKTEWHNIVAYRRLGEICGEFLSKGKQIYIEGKIQNRSWENKEGIKQYKTEIVADTMQMLGSRGGGGGGSNYGGGAPSAGSPSSSSKSGDLDDVPF